MSILFVQHGESEGPGHFRRVLDEQNVPFQVLKAFLPVNFMLPGDCRGVIMLGGPMNVDDESDAPFLSEEKADCRSRMSQLGI